MSKKKWINNCSKIKTCKIRKLANKKYKCAKKIKKVLFFERLSSIRVVGDP